MGSYTSMLLSEHLFKSWIYTTKGLLLIPSISAAPFLLRVSAVVAAQNNNSNETNVYSLEYFKGRVLQQSWKTFTSNFKHILISGIYMQLFSCRIFDQLKKFLAHWAFGRTGPLNICQCFCFAQGVSRQAQPPAEIFQW